MRQRKARRKDRNLRNLGKNIPVPPRCSGALNIMAHWVSSLCCSDTAEARIFARMSAEGSITWSMGDWSMLAGGFILAELVGLLHPLGQQHCKRVLPDLFGHYRRSVKSWFPW
jgi:hypothetical protein